MRFSCSFGILFFLALGESEGATQAECTTTTFDWWWTKQQKTCTLDVEVVDGEDFTISSDDRLTFGLWLSQKAGVKFLPTNVSQVFPDLVAFKVEQCSITTVSRDHFKNLSKLKEVHLFDNKIEHVASDAFVDLVSLEYLYLDGNKIQSLNANWFSSLKALKLLSLAHNKKIQHLEPKIFNSLVGLEKIFLSDNSIAALDEKIFESLTNLRIIFLEFNKLKEIPKNLFRNNLKLEEISFYENDIQSIDPKMFDHLPNLEKVYLGGNCVDKYFYDKRSFGAMRSDLRQNCSPVQLSAACGAPRHTSDLIEGESFPHGAFPWIVALMLTKSRPHHFFCAGTLVSETFVISAAHCILNKGDQSQLLPRDILAIFGAHDLDNPYESERIMKFPIEIFIHEDWNHQITSYADISLLKFENGKIHFGDFIQPICLWNSKTDPNVTTGVVIGWRKSEDTTKNYENLPKMILAPILANEKCFLDDSGLTDISSERTFCAGLRNGSGVCQGDSGGGLFINVDGVYYLKGIVSSSKVTDQGCDVSRNAVYTNVLKFMDWIKEKTQ